MTMVHADAFHVVFVCTGNRARSPLAEALFRERTIGLHADVASFGTLELGPAPALVTAIEAARSLGVDISRHRARSLSETDLSAADLVLGFEPAHVSAAVIEGRAPAERTFLLGEFVLLLDGERREEDPYLRARATVVTADSRRVRPRASRDAVVIEDPMGRSQKAMRRTAEDIEDLVNRVASGLFGIEVVGNTTRSRRRPWIDPRRARGAGVGPG